MKNGQRCGGTKRRSDLLAGAELFFCYGNHRYVIFVLCSAELFFRLWKSSFLHKNNLGDLCSVFALIHADFGDIRVDAKTKK